MHPARATFHGRRLRETQRFDFRQRKTLQMKQGNRRRKQARKQAVHLTGIQKGAFPAGRVLRQETRAYREATAPMANMAALK